MTDEVRKLGGCEVTFAAQPNKPNKQNPPSFFSVDKIKSFLHPHHHPFNITQLEIQIAEIIKK